MTRARLLAEIATMPERQSRHILVTGAPGIGKSRVIDEAASGFASAGFVVLRATPSFAERHTAYSMLWDLLSPLDLGSFETVPAEYRSFLKIALGLEPSSSDPPSLAAAIALEGILRESSSTVPLVMIVDDLQWADRESLATLERAVRRLDGQPVYLVAASRDSPDATSASLRLAFDPRDVRVLGGLSVEELDAAIRPHWPSALTRGQIVALHEHTGGNPLWAIEVLAGGHFADLGARPVGTIAAPPSLAVTIAERLAILSGHAADVVSIVALLGHPRLELLASVLRFADIPECAAEEAEAAGFLSVSTQSAQTRHPLQASAAAARLAPARRRELHAFIADAVDDGVVRAQHLQLSRPAGPDESIAVALSSAAHIMRRRGARLRSAHFAAQAVDRTDPLSPHYQNRVLGQAQQLFSAGDPAASLRATGHLSSHRLDPHQYDAYVALSSSSLSASRGHDAVASFLYRQAGEAVSDPVRAAIVLANTVADDLLPVTDRAARASASLASLAGIDAPNAVHRAIKGMIRSQIDAGRGLNQHLIDDSTRREGVQIVVGLDDTGLATTAAYSHLLDDVDRSRRALAELVEWARSEGKDGAERLFLAQAAQVEFTGGDLTAARRFIRDSHPDPTATGLTPEVLPVLGLVLNSDDQHERLEHSIARWEASDLGSGLFRDMIAPALRGFSAVATGAWPRAVDHLRRAAGVADSLGLVEPGSRFRIDLPLVEALLMNGEGEEASVRLAALRAFVATRDRPISRIGVHRLTSLERAAAGDLDGALLHADLAIDFAAQANRPTDEALSRLQRALVLTRLRKVTLGRRELEAAQQLAEQGASPNVCRRVRSASATARTVTSPSQLTAAEVRVHAAVLSGQSNKEIAAALFLSVRTVESHVSAVLRKTGAASRSKLRSQRP
jgi:DNA-binding CsgD family transcriptional regulator